MLTLRVGENYDSRAQLSHTSPPSAHVRSNAGTTNQIKVERHDTVQAELDMLNNVQYHVRFTAAYQWRYHTSYTERGGTCRKSAGQKWWTPRKVTRTPIFLSRQAVRRLLSAEKRSRCKIGRTDLGRRDRTPLDEKEKAGPQDGRGGRQSVRSFRVETASHTLQRRL